MDAVRKRIFNSSALRAQLDPPSPCFHLFTVILPSQIEIVRMCEAARIFSYDGWLSNEAEASDERDFYKYWMRLYIIILPHLKDMKYIYTWIYLNLKRFFIHPIFLIPVRKKQQLFLWIKFIFSPSYLAAQRGLEMFKEWTWLYLCLKANGIRCDSCILACKTYFNESKMNVWMWINV